MNRRARTLRAILGLLAPVVMLGLFPATALADTSRYEDPTLPADQRVVFSFGQGLSYTTFRIEGVKVLRSASPRENLELIPKEPLR